MSRMAELASMFGVDIDEEFTVIKQESVDRTPSYATCKAKFKETGLYEMKYGIWRKNNNELVNMLAFPELYQFEIKPFMPKLYKNFWYVGLHGYAENAIWNDNLFCRMAFLLGNCYRTKQQAQLNSEKWKKRFEE